MREKCKFSFSLVKHVVFVSNFKCNFQFMCNKMNTSILAFSVINIYIVLHVQIVQKQVLW